MKETRISIPELALIAGTRAAAGAGLGLLLSHRLSESQRRAIGWTLLLIGAVSTLPLALDVFGRSRSVSPVETERIDNATRPEAEVQPDQPRILART